MLKLSWMDSSNNWTQQLWNYRYRRTGSFGTWDYYETSRFNGSPSHNTIAAQSFNAPSKFNI